MDRSGKRCLACGYNGDGHYTHCNVPTKQRIVEAIERLEKELKYSYEGCDIEDAYKKFAEEMRGLVRVELVKKGG